jgi:hypothetical protein
MCHEYAREIEIARIIRYMQEMKHGPPFEYEAGRVPYDIAPQPSVLPWLPLLLATCCLTNVRNQEVRARH